MMLECRNGSLAPVAVALVVAIGEPCCDFAQVALLDWLAAHRAESLRSGGPVSHQDESHVPSPNERSCHWLCCLCIRMKPCCRFNRTREHCRSCGVFSQRKSINLLQRWFA